MSRIFSKTSSIKLPQRNRDVDNESFFHEHAGITECSSCPNVHYKKRWYASEADLQKHLEKKLPVIKTKICQACQMINDHMFEGEIIIENFPENYRAELFGLVKNYGQRATQIDPQDRVIEIEKIENGYRVTTTENQLADKLAKKIKDAFNTVSVHFSHSPEPAEVVRIHIQFFKKQ